MWNKNKKANKMFDWNVYVCHIFEGEKEFIGCHQVGHVLHENWWNQHLEQFIYICSDTRKTKKKSDTNPEHPKKKQLRKTWKEICIDDGEVTAEWRVHTKKKET